MTRWAFVSVPPSSPHHPTPQKAVMLWGVFRVVWEGGLTLCTNIKSASHSKIKREFARADRAGAVFDVCLSDSWNCSAGFEVWVVSWFLAFSPNLFKMFDITFLGPAHFLQGMRTVLQTAMPNVLFLLPHPHF